MVDLNLVLSINYPRPSTNAMRSITKITINKTRMVVPTETVRAASLPYDYENFVKAFAEGDEDDF